MIEHAFQGRREPMPTCDKTMIAASLEKCGRAEFKSPLPSALRAVQFNGALEFQAAPYLVQNFGPRLLRGARPVFFGNLRQEVLRVIESRDRKEQ
jgi:hypothetical protein